MNIIEAIAQTGSGMNYITRAAWRHALPFRTTAAVKVLPTDSPEGCLLLSCALEKYTPWQPRLEDLIADDWRPVS